MEHYFENVLMGFKRPTSKVVLKPCTRDKTDFILMDIDHDGMLEMLFAFKYKQEKKLGVLKREDYKWRLHHVPSTSVNKKINYLERLKVQENVSITPRYMNREMTIEQFCLEEDYTFLAMVDGVVYKGQLEPISMVEPLEEIDEEVTNDLDLETIDFEQGDVIGDGYSDRVVLLGTRVFGEAEGVVRNMTLRIDTIDEENPIYVTLPEGAGYNPRLFIGDFTGSGINNVLISYFTQIEDGFIYSYIYTFEEDSPRLIFDSRTFNEQYRGDVRYLDQYRVEVTTTRPGKTFIINISDRDPEYLAQLYDANGILLRDVRGSIGGIFAVNPADFDGDKIYNLSALQQITGVNTTDTLGLLETVLKFNPLTNSFEPFMQYISLIGTPVP